MWNLTRTMALDWAADNIQVNLIAPGWIRTEMTESVLEDTERTAHIVAETPAGRFGVPEDLAGTGVFHASAASDFITGTYIRPSGWPGGRHHGVAAAERRHLRVADRAVVRRRHHQPRECRDPAVPLVAASFGGSIYSRWPVRVGRMSPRVVPVLFSRLCRKAVYIPQTVTGTPAPTGARRKILSAQGRSDVRSNTIRWPASAPQRSI